MVRIQSIWALCVVMVAAVVLTGCGSPQDAWQKINNENALIVDVRTPEEFKAGHVPGALLIPEDQVQSRLGEFGDDKSRAIVVYCKRGVRSGRAMKTLEAAGYTNVVNGGGYEDMMASKPN